MTAKNDEPPELATPQPVEVIPGRSLHRKLAEVMAEVGRIPKRGKAPAAMGGFEFVQVGDAADTIRKALGERSVSMLPSQVEVVSENEHATKSGGTMTTQSIRTTWTLTDGETGEVAVIQSLGTGADTGDKFSPKAQSNAMKYALLMGFLLSTGDDPELSDSSDRRARRDQQIDEAKERMAIVSGPAFDPATAELSGLIGTAEIGKSDADFNIRQVSTPDRPQPFPRIAFRLTEGRRGIKVEAIDTLAELIHDYRAGIEGYRVTCWGHLRDETFTPKKADGTLAKPITYQILTLSRLKVGQVDLSAPDEPDEPEEPTAADAEPYGDPELFPVSA